MSVCSKDPNFYLFGGSRTSHIIVVFLQLLHVTACFLSVVVEEAAGATPTVPFATNNVILPIHLLAGNLSSYKQSTGMMIDITEQIWPVMSATPFLFVWGAVISEISEYFLSVGFVYDV